MQFVAQLRDRPVLQVVVAFGLLAIIVLLIPGQTLSDLLAFPLAYLLSRHVLMMQPRYIWTAFAINTALGILLFFLMLGAGGGAEP